MDTQNAIDLSIKLTQGLRYSFTKALETLSNPIDKPGENKNDNFLSNCQSNLDTISKDLEELDKIASNLKPLNGLQSAGILTSFGIESTQEKYSLYQNLNKNYRYISKLNNYSTLFGQNFQQAQSLLQIRRFGSINRRRKLQQSNLNRVDLVQNIILQLQRANPSSAFMLSSKHKFPGYNHVVQMTQAKIFKAIIVLRGPIIEWVVVKAFSEKLHMDNGDIDFWSSSKYEIFRKITDQAEIMSNLLNQSMNDNSLQTLLKWLQTYQNIFSAPCSKCSRHLKDLVLPYGRDLRGDPFHEQCHKL